MPRDFFDKNDDHIQLGSTKPTAVPPGFTAPDDATICPGTFGHAPSDTDPQSGVYN